MQQKKQSYSSDATVSEEAVMVTEAELGGVQLDGWMLMQVGLSEAGVGAAGATVLPLAALDHAGNLQARHH